MQVESSLLALSSCAKSVMQLDDYRLDQACG